jgi:hypothetical protein
MADDLARVMNDPPCLHWTQVVDVSRYTNDSCNCIEVSYYVKLFDYLFVTVQRPAAHLWMHFLYPIHLLLC